MNEIATTNDIPKTRRRWLRFSLRSLLVLMAVIGVWLGFEKSRVLKQAQVAAKVRALGGDVFSGYRFDPSGKPKEFSKRTVPPWITNFIGEDYFVTIVTVNFDKNFGDRPADRSKAHATQVTNEALVLLEDAPHVTELLLAGNNQLSDDCLAHAAGLKHLRVLLLNQTNATGRGLSHIRALPNLEGLALHDTPLTDDGLAFLGGLPKLQWLLLDDTDISDKGLANLTSLRSLQHLSLNNTRITDQGLQQLQKLPRLTRLSLGGTAVTSEGCAALQRALPSCKIFPP